MRFRVVVGLVATATATVAALSVTPAQAAAPLQITSCGQNITRDAYLTHDLTCDVGFTFRAPDVDAPPVEVTVDLRGHRLRGTGSGVAFAIYDSPRYPTVVVTNGRVDHWGYGAAVDFGGVRLSNLRLDHNTTAVDCGGACVVENSTITHNTVGTTAHEANLTLTDNVISSNGVGSQTGGVVSGNQYSSNAYTDNLVGVRITPQGFVNLSRNVFTRNGVGVQATDDTESEYVANLDRNLFVGNGDGIYLKIIANTDSAELRGNVVLNSKRYGIYAPGATDLGANVAAGNGSRPQCVGVVCTRPY